MKNYLKYELKGQMKFILGILILLIVSSTIFQFSIVNVTKVEENPVGIPQSIIVIILLGVSGVIVWSAFIILGFYLVNSYNKELLEETGYLTFTLPITKREIVGAKLISATTWSVVIVLITLIYNLMLGFIILKTSGVDLTEFSKFLNYIEFKHLRAILVFILASIFNLILTIAIIYFAMTLRKIIFGGKRMNVLWVVIAMVTKALLGIVNFKISDSLPLNLNILSFEVNNLNIWEMNSYISSVGDAVHLNLTTIVVDFIFTILLFEIISYLLDKKIDI